MFPEFFRLRAGLLAAMLLLAWAGLGGESSASMQDFSRGETAFRAGDYRSAILYYHRAADKNPNFTAAYLGSARSYLALSDLKRAEEYFLRVAALRKFEIVEMFGANVPTKKPTDNKKLADLLVVAVGLGQVYTLQGRYREAALFLKGAARLDPSNLENNYALARYYHETENFNLANFYYEKVRQSNPLYIPALLGLAELEAKKGDYSLVDRYLADARKIHAIDPAIFSVQGDIYLQRALEARDDARRALYLERTHASYSTALNLSQENIRAEKKLIVIDLYRNELEASLRRTESLLLKLPDSTELNYMFSFLTRKQSQDYKNVKRSLGLIEKTITLDPGDSVARFSLEELLLKNANKPDTRPLRRALADYHYRRTKYYDAKNRSDRMRIHLLRTLELNPLHMEARKDQLELYRRDGDYENFLRALIGLRKLLPDDERLHFRLEQALRGKNESAPFRENLLSRAGSGEKSTFKRTPTLVFIFDFQPEAPFPYHPDASKLLVSALKFHLAARGRVRALAEEQRAELLDRINLIRGPQAFFSYGLYYRPEFIPIIEANERADVQTTHLIHGTFVRNSEGYAVTYEIIEKNTGSRIDSFTLTAGDRDAIHDISARAADRIVETLPYTGRIVKVSSKGVFLNLGKVDGIKKDMLFQAGRFGRSKGFLKVVEVSAYISRCEPVEGDWNGFDTHDVVRPFGEGVLE